MPTIAATADVHESARLADDVIVDDYAQVQAGCNIGSGTHIMRHSIIWQGTTIGSGNRIFPFCSLGGEPQDKKFRGERAPLVIGDDNTIREFCFINQGTAASGETRIGSRNLLMAYVHAAHDCIVGDDCVIANQVQLAGHVTVGDAAIIGGGCLVHQFCRIGGGGMLRGGERVVHDIPPFALCGLGHVAVNQEGLRRRGVASDNRQNLNRAYRLLYRSGQTLAAALAEIQKLSDEHPSDELQALIAFCQQDNLNLIRPSRNKDDE